MLTRILRGLLIAVLCAALVGFGVCGAFGTLGGVASLVEDNNDGSLARTMIICGVLGLAVAWVAWLAIAALWRRRGQSGRNVM